MARIWSMYGQDMVVYGQDMVVHGQDLVVYGQDMVVQWPGYGRFFHGLIFGTASTV